MPTPQSPNTKPVNTTGNPYVHPDHGVIAAPSQGVTDFGSKGKLPSKPASTPAPAAKPTGKITITAGPAPTPKPSGGANKPDLRVVGGSGTKGWNF